VGSIYSSLGLTRNPFAWDDGYDTGPFLNHLGLDTPVADAQRLLQLVGDRGAGKSTHMRHWHKITGGIYYYVEPEGRAVLPIGPIVYWDEADRVSDRQLKRSFKEIARIGGTVVAGTHRDLSKPARASGLEVDTIRFGQLKPEVLSHWCQARIDAASDGRPQFLVPGTVLDQVCAESKSSLRDAGDLLHMWVARQARASGEA